MALRPTAVPFEAQYADKIFVVNWLMRREPSPRKAAQPPPSASSSLAKMMCVKAFLLVEFGRKSTDDCQVEFTRYEKTFCGSFVDHVQVCEVSLHVEQH